MTPDLGREAVYAAEIAAFEGTSYEVVTALEQLIELAALIINADWWPRGPIRVVAARTDAASSSTRQRGIRKPVVRLAAPQMTSATLVHEFAHVLAGVGNGHRSVFRCAHVDLAGYTFGATEASWLLDAYRSMDLALGERAWSAPPIRRATGGPVAL